MKLNEGQCYFLSSLCCLALYALLDRPSSHLSVTSTLRVIFHEVCLHFEQLLFFLVQPLYFT